MTIQTRPIASIKVGERVRSDLGDIDALAESIRANGALLQPVVILPDGSLIAGARRLEACRRLGRAQVEVTVRPDLSSAVAQLIAERDENTCRLDMTPSEKVALGRKLEELERPAAESRRTANLPSPNGSRDPLGEKGRVRESVGQALGMSGTSYDRAKTVVEAAERGDPIAVEARAMMDRTGKIRPAAERVTGHGNVTGSSPFVIRTERQRQIAQAEYRRVDGAIAHLQGLCEGLSGANFPKALAVAEAATVTHWLKTAESARHALRDFGSNLKEAQQ